MCSLEKYHLKITIIIIITSRINFPYIRSIFLYLFATIAILSLMMMIRIMHTLKPMNCSSVNFVIYKYMEIF